MTKAELFDSFRWEMTVIRFLASKATPADTEYRPSPEQRSLGELLSYLSTTGISSMIAFENGNWDHYAKYKERAASTTLENFDARMEEQQKEIENYFEKVSEADLAGKRVKLAWEAEMSLGAGLVEQPLKFFTAYRMQLFLYLKAAGHTGLTTWEAWGAKDAPPKKEA